MLRTLLLGSLLAFTISVVAQQPPPPHKATPAQKTTPSSSPASPAKVEDIRKLLELTGSRGMVNQMKVQLMDQFRQASPNLPKEMFDEMLAEMKPEDLEEAIIPIYVKHFSESDIKQLIAFYESPFGRKVMHEMPQIMEESNQVGAEWGQNIVMTVAHKWRKEGKLTQREYEQLVGEEEPH